MPSQNQIYTGPGSYGAGGSGSQNTSTPTPSRPYPGSGTSTTTGQHGPTLENLVPTFAEQHPFLTPNESYGNYRDATQYNLDRAAQLMGGYTGGYSSGGGSGGGYGGGGGYAGPSAADTQAYLDAMKQLIGGMGGPAVGGVNRLAAADIQNPYAGMESALAGMVNPLTGMIDPAVDRDIAEAQAAFAAVAGGVDMDDPYANLQIQAGQVDPALAEFAARQGVGADYEAQVALANQEGQNVAANWEGLQGVLGQNHLAGQQAIIDAANQQGALVQSGFEGQRTQLEAAAAAQQLQMDREAAQDQQQIDLAAAQFDTTLEQMIAEYQMQLDAERRATETSGNQDRLAALMELLNAGFQYGNVPSLEGLI